jgi:hypothetical protein
MPLPLLEALQTTSRLRTVLEIGSARGFVTYEDVCDLPLREV